MYHSFLIHSSADGHLGCFHVVMVKMELGTSYRMNQGAVLELQLAAECPGELVKTPITSPHLWSY